MLVMTSSATLLASASSVCTFFASFLQEETASCDSLSTSDAPTDTVEVGLPGQQLVRTCIATRFKPIASQRKSHPLTEFSSKKHMLSSQQDMVTQHSEILEYLSLHFAQTESKLPNLVVHRCCQSGPESSAAVASESLAAFGLTEA